MLHGATKVNLLIECNGFPERNFMIALIIFETLIITTIAGFFFYLDDKNQKANDAYIEDYKKWAIKEIERIIKTE